MTPKEYLDRYTYLAFFSPMNFQMCNAGISGYGSYWNQRLYAGMGNHKSGGIVKGEFDRFMRALRMAHHGNPNTPCGEKFFFDKRPLGLIAKEEEFYATTISNAFIGKGSPDEITDTMRLADAIGRIGPAGTVDAAGQTPACYTSQEYAAEYMTLDCNGLVRNFYGTNYNDIKFYAVAARRRMSAGEVQIGDCVITHAPNIPYEHIGLIGEWSATGNSAVVRIVEWGAPGGESEHFKAPAGVTVQRGAVGQFGVGWPTTSNAKDHKGEATFKYIFAPPASAGPLGWS